MVKRILEKYRSLFWSCEKFAKHKGVKIGQNCLISTKNFPAEAYLITIGDYCRLAKGVSFFTHGGIWSQRKRLKKDFDYFGKIVIGNYTYLGEDVKVLPGVTIGNNVIVGAGSIVTKSIPDNVICAGNPAKIVGNVEEFIERLIKTSVDTYHLSFEEKKSFLLNLSDDKFVKK